MELYASFMARSKTIPILRITSKECKPQWMAPYESVLLSLGKTQFSCCQRNHRMGNGIDAVDTPCDRPRCLSIARPMLDRKIKHLYTHDRDFTRARLVQCLRKRFLEGLSNTSSIDSQYTETSIGESDDGYLSREEDVSCSDEGYHDIVLRLKASLRWMTGEDADWFDRGGISILIYSILRRDLRCTKLLISTLSFSTTSRERSRRINSLLPGTGYPSFFLTGNMNSLCIAMAFSSAEIVSLLLQEGAEVSRTDVNGLDPLMFASMTGNLECVNLWLNCFRKWDLRRRERRIGANVLHLACRIGSNHYDVVKRLLDAGADIDSRTRKGLSVLGMAVSNDDVSVDVARLIVKTSRASLNRQNSSQRTSHENMLNGKREMRLRQWSIWDIMTWVLTYCSIIPDKASLAEEVGDTVLHCAVKNGDADLVELLIWLGCDPNVTDRKGNTPIETAKKSGMYSDPMRIAFEKAASHSPSGGVE